MWIVVALAPLWVVGLFGRALWTPDEPREADIAWRMSLQSDRSLPVLAGVPFLEKPPLSYWMSGAGVALFGDHPAAARAPNLLYALVTAFSLAALALAMGLGRRGAACAALAGGSALILFRVQSWLAPDAGLLAGNALALLGLWWGYTARSRPRKLLGYTLMHLGAALGFMAKSAPGWLVPALALLALLAWERRWSELRRPELYAGFALQALLIGPWLLAVAHGPGGAPAVRTLFWNNVVGRFTHLDAPPELDYASGHPNRPGKYFFELPLYLLPWTLLAAAALVSAVRAVRRGSADRALRFALCAALPFLVLLSFAATARDIYAAPALLGFALLIGVWLARLPPAAPRLDALCLAGTRYLLLMIALAMVAFLWVLGASGAAPVLACALAAVVLLGAVTVTLWRARRHELGGAHARALRHCFVAYVATVVLGAVVAFPVIDRWQDLQGLALRIRTATAGAPLALLAPDETTLAMIDHGFAGSFSVLTRADPEEARRWFAARGPRARLLVLMPGHAPGAVSRYLERWLRPAPQGDGLAGRLLTSGGARLVGRYELPQGRRYALLGPPPG